MKAVRDRKGKHALRRAAGFLLAATVIFPVSYAWAADANSFLQDYAAEEEDRLTVYCANLAENGESGAAGQFTATISGQECPVLEVSTAEQKQEGITYYCLVDVSGSMHREQMEQAKGVLAKICESLGENDNMVIGAMGTTLETTGFLTDQEEIRVTIDGLAGESDYTAIYDAVVDSVSVLQSHHDCNRKKCLVLISDGCDETELGTTREEAAAAAADSDIPVYTVAVMRQTPDAQQKEAAERLGAFARQSTGGKDYPPVGGSSAVGEFDAEEAGGNIVEDMRNGAILTLDVSQVEAAKDEVLLSVSFQTDTATYSDTMYLYAAELNSSSGEDPDDPVPAAPNDPVPVDPDDPVPAAPDISVPADPDVPAGIPIPVYAAVGAALIFIVTLIILFLCRRKKNRKEAEERAAAEKEKAEREAAARVSAGKAAVGKKAREGQNADTTDLTEFRFPASKPETYYEVKFTAIDHENVVFTLRIPEGKTLTVGRNNRADLVLNPEDRHLSSVQCRVRCMGKKMDVWDMNSQNGTFVNGVPVRNAGMAVVRDNDVIRMGSYEYRINIKSTDGGGN